jgi:hypothetical protein
MYSCDALSWNLNVNKVTLVTKSLTTYTVDEKAEVRYGTGYIVSDGYRYIVGQEMFVIANYLTVVSISISVISISISGGASDHNRLYLRPDSHRNIIIII